MTIGTTPLQIIQPEYMTDISMAMLDNNLDTYKQTGQSMIKMMEQSVQPDLGQNIDIRV